MDRLRHAIASSYRTQRRLAVLMLDMDGLKPINDTFGHRAGDAALQELARRIAAELRQSDTVARFGGDEFAYLLSTVPDRESAQVVAQRIARRCDRPFDFEGQTFQIGASVGVAIGPDDGDEPEVLLELADRDMHARSGGSNGDPRLTAKRIHRLRRSHRFLGDTGVTPATRICGNRRNQWIPCLPQAPSATAPARSAR